MKGCGAHEDALVAYATGRLRGPAVQRVEGHLDACASCRENLAVIRMVRETPVPVPDGLESRIRGTVRDAAARDRVHVSSSGSQLGGRGRASWRAWGVPLAAAAMLTAVLAVGRNGPAVTDPDAAAYAPYGTLPGSDGFLAGDALLSELTVEELEQLLEEMES